MTDYEYLLMKKEEVIDWLAELNAELVEIEKRERVIRARWQTRIAELHALNEALNTLDEVEV